MTTTPEAVERFKASLQAASPPAGLPPLLLALWHAGRDDWETAHRITQEEEGKVAAAVHAYLHRVEGDLSNARYWYRRADRAEFKGPLGDEWDRLAGELLAD